jgi:hypothetical protein
MKKILLLSFLLSSFFSFGQVMFQKTYGGVGGAAGRSLQRISDGGFIIAGRVGASTYLIRTNEFGDTVWTKAFASSPGCFPFCVKQASDGGFIICGYGSGSEAVLLKTDSSGNYQWGSYYNSGLIAFGTSVAETSTGEYVYIGILSSLQDYIIYGKVDADGNNISYVGSNPRPVIPDPSVTSNGYDVISLNDGGLAFCGFADTGAIWTQIFIERKSPSNNWRKIYGAIGERFSAFSITQTSDGGFAVCGDADSLFVMKIDANGNLEWAKEYGGFGGNSIRQTSDGGFIIAGGYRYNSLNHAYAVRTDSVGDLLWAKIYGDTSSTEIHSVDIANDGGYMLVGAINISSVYNLYLVKTDS